MNGDIEGELTHIGEDEHSLIDYLIKLEGVGIATLKG